MPTYRTIKPSDWTKSLIFIGIYVATISITAFILLVTYWYVWIALVAGGMFLLVLWHKKSTAYHCLKCPKCQNRTKMQILVKQIKED